uniref:hypothetical protein n=1 Tax=Candidatus Electronema sp. TaxID=2698783 RepID=UPI0040565BD0
MNREALSAIPLVKTPLGLLALVLLIVESILGVVALNSNEQLQSSIAIGMLAALFLVILGVIALAFLRPRSLYGQPTESKREIVAVYIPYSQSLLEKAEKQIYITRRVESSLMQLFPKGVPEGVEPKEWQIISLLLKDQSNFAVTILETAKQLHHELRN